MDDELDEEQWEPMPSVVGVPLPDEDGLEEPRGVTDGSDMESFLDLDETDLLEVVSGVPLPEPPPPPAPRVPAPRALVPPPPTPFTPASQAMPDGAARSSFVDLDDLLEEVIRDDSTRPIPFVPRPELAKLDERPGRRWPYALAALAAGVLVAYGLSGRRTPAPERTRAATPSWAETSPEAAGPARGGAPAAEETEATRALTPATTPIAQEPADTNAAVPPESAAPQRSAVSRGPRGPRARAPRRARQTPTPHAATGPRTPSERRQGPAQDPVVQAPAAPVIVRTPVVVRTPAPESREDLPETPTRAQVQAAFTRILPNLRACTDSRGAVPIRVTISGSGRITTAVVQGHFAGTPEGSCLARAVRTAHLPAFQQRRLSVNYPFVL